MGKEIIEKCHYPQCKLDIKANHMITITNDGPDLDPNGKYIIALMPPVVEKPFCWYHYHVVAGNHFTAIWDDENKIDSTLQGPFEQVELINQVIAAKMIMEKINEEEQKKQDN